MSTPRLLRMAARPSVAFLLLSLSAHAGITGARAQPGNHSPENVIGWSDDETGKLVQQVDTRGYDLASQDGRARLMQRIERAVRRVCRNDDRGTLSEAGAYETCHDDSIANAVGQVDVLVARAGGGQVQVADDTH